MTKATRSLIASEIGIERARKALIDMGINQTGLEERLGFSRSTISSFFNRTKPIDHPYFTKICKTLKLDWEEIVEKDNPMKLDSCQIENTTDVEINSPRLKKAFVIEGSFPIDALTQAKIQALVKQLQKITGDASLEIVDIQEGSIKIILKGTPEALAMIQDLHDSGQLNELFQIADLSGANPSINQSALENVTAGGNVNVTSDQAIFAQSTMKNPMGLLQLLKLLKLQQLKQAEIRRLKALASLEAPEDLEAKIETIQNQRQSSEVLKVLEAKIEAIQNQRQSSEVLKVLEAKIEAIQNQRLFTDSPRQHTDSPRQHTDSPRQRLKKFLDQKFKQLK